MAIHMYVTGIGKGGNLGGNEYKEDRDTGDVRPSVLFLLVCHLPFFGGDQAWIMAV